MDAITQKGRMIKRLNEAKLTNEFTVMSSKMIVFGLTAILLASASAFNASSAEECESSRGSFHLVVFLASGKLESVQAPISYDDVDEYFIRLRSDCQVSEFEARPCPRSLSRKTNGYNTMSDFSDDPLGKSN